MQDTEFVNSEVPMKNSPSNLDLDVEHIELSEINRFAGSPTINFLLDDIEKTNEQNAKPLFVFGQNLIEGNSTNPIEKTVKILKNSKKLAQGKTLKKKKTSIADEISNVLKNKLFSFGDDDDEDLEVMSSESKKNGYNRFKKSSKLNNLVFEKALAYRKAFRLIFMLFLSGLFTGLFIASSTDTVLKGTFYMEDAEKISLNIIDCWIYILETDISSYPYIEYSILRDYRSDYKSRAIKEKVENENNYYNLTFINEFPLVDSYLSLYIPKEYDLTYLSIDCPRGSCQIIQKSSHLKVTDIIDITTSEGYVNLNEIESRLFIYVEKGHIQLNEMKYVGYFDLYLLLGDIIIDSSSYYRFYAQVPTQSFCITAPYSRGWAEDCAIHTDDQTNISYGNTDCFVYRELCAEDCVRLKYEFGWILTGNGSLYASLRLDTMQPIDQEHGRILDYGVNFSPNIIEGLDLFNKNLSDTTKNSPTLILNIGGWWARSNHFAKFVITADPAYTYVKPYWLESVSATLLAVTRQTVDGFLLPGTCPYRGTYSKSDLYAIQEKLYEYLNGTKALVSLIIDPSSPMPEDQPIKTPGIWWPSMSKNPYKDTWYSISVDDNLKYIFSENSITKSPFGLGALIISLIISVYGAVLLMMLIIYFLNAMYFKIHDEVNHLQNYVRIMNKQAAGELDEEAKENAQIKPEYNLATLLRLSPSLACYIDYFVMYVFKYYSRSANLFYDALFFKGDDKEDIENIDPSKDMITGDELKQLYEKFCFVCNYNEEKITENQYKKLLKKKGFVFKQDSTLMVPVFLKMHIKLADNFYIGDLEEEEGEDDDSEENTNDSLQIYIKKNVELTSFEEDQVEVQTFIKLYNNFCDFNKLEKIPVTPSLMLEKHNFPSIEVPAVVVTRSADFFDPTHKNFRKRSWIIDQSLIRDYLHLKMENYDAIPKERVDRVIKYEYRYGIWFIKDIIVVITQMFFNVVLAIPVVLILILIETSYSPYPVKDADILISDEEVSLNPIKLFEKLWNGFGWNVVVLVAVCGYWILNFFDLMVYYFYLRLPPENEFKDGKKEKCIPKFARYTQWVITIIMLFFVLCYLVLFLIWWVLAAILNPNLFLPYTTGALTFVAFVTQKYNQLVELFENGRDAILSYLGEINNEHLNKVMEILSNKIEGAAKYVTDKAKEFANGPILDNVAVKVAALGIVSNELISRVKERILKAQEEAEGEDDVEFIDKLKDEMEECVERKDYADTMKTECRKKMIPQEIIDMTLAIIDKDQILTKTTAETLLIGQLSRFSQLDPNLINLGFDLAYPMSVVRESLPKYALTVLIEKILSNASVDTSGGNYNIPDFVELLEMAINLIHYNMKSYYTGIDDMLASPFLRSEFKKIDNFQPLLDLFKILSQERSPEEFIIPLLHFSKSSLPYLLDSESPESDKVLKLLDTTLNLIPLLSGIKHPNIQPLNNEEVYQSINSFINLIPFADEKNERETKAASLAIYSLLVLSMQRTHELPKAYLEDFAEFFDFEPKSVEFVLQLVDLQFNKENNFSTGFDQKAVTYNIHEDIKIFLKFIFTFQARQEDQLVSLRKEIYTNPILIFTCQKLKITDNELIGLIEFMNNHLEAPTVKYFYLGLMKRLNINPDYYSEIKALIDLLICDNNEKLVLSALKSLNVKEYLLVLISKGFLDPKYVRNEVFTELGVRIDIAMKKNYIYEMSHEYFLEWKKELCECIGDNETFDEEKIFYYQFLLSDWSTTSFTSKRIIDFLSILDKIGKLKLRNYIPIFGDQQESVLLELLRRILHLREISHKHHSDRPFNLIKSEPILRVVSQEFGLNLDVFRSLAELILTKDCDPKKFLSQVIPPVRFKDFRINSYAEVSSIYHSLSTYSSSYQESCQAMDGFIEKFCKLIKPGGFEIPKGLIKKFMIEEDYHLKINRFLEFCDYILKITDNEDISQEYMSALVEWRLAGSGYLDIKTLKNSPMKTSPYISHKLFEITSSNLREERFYLMTSLFDEQHVLLTTLCLKKFLEEGNSKMKYPMKDRKADLWLVDFLAKEFNVFPEVFHLLSNLHVKEVDDFLEFGMPILRRLTNNTLIDEKMVKTIFGILLGRPFDSSYLAFKLLSEESSISFLSTLSRLASREGGIAIGEVKILDNQVHFKRVLKKLNLDFTEISSLIRILLGNFTSDELNPLLKAIGLSDDERATAYSLFCLCKAVDPSKDYEASLDDIENSVVSIQKSAMFSEFDAKKVYIAAIFRAIAGNYLAIKGYPEIFDWAFPGDTSSYICVRNLTMGLLGILNRRIQYDAFRKMDQSFSRTVVEEFRPVIEREVDAKFMKFNYYKKVEIKESEDNSDNSIKHALALLCSYADINPDWALYFFLDMYTFESSEHKELILLAIAYFATIPEIEFDQTSRIAAKIRYISYLEDLKQTGYDQQRRKLKERLANHLTIERFTFQNCANFIREIHKDNIFYWQDLIYSKENFEKKVNKSAAKLLKIEDKDLPIAHDFLENANKVDWLQLIIQLYMYTKPKMRIPRSGFETFLILGLITKIRYSKDVVKSTYCVDVLLKMFERFLLLDGSFYKFSRSNILKILALSQYKVIFNVTELIDARELYDNSTKELIC